MTDPLDELASAARAKRKKRPAKAEPELGWELGKALGIYAKRRKGRVYTKSGAKAFAWLLLIALLAGCCVVTSVLKSLGLIATAI